MVQLSQVRYKVLHLWYMVGGDRHALWLVPTVARGGSPSLADVRSGTRPAGCGEPVHVAGALLQHDLLAQLRHRGAPAGTESHMAYLTSSILRRARKLGVLNSQKYTPEATGIPPSLRPFQVTE